MYQKGPLYKAPDTVGAVGASTGETAVHRRPQAINANGEAGRWSKKRCPPQVRQGETGIGETLGIPIPLVYVTHQCQQSTEF